MLQSFALVRHPETDKVWWIPEGLDTPRKPAKGESDETEEADDPSSAATKGETGDEATGAPEEQAKYRYPIRVLARQDLIENFSTVGRKYYGGHKRLTHPGVPTKAKWANWRPDMYWVILDQRRRQIMDELLYLSTLCEENGRKYIIRVTDAKYAATYVHRAAFLWLGDEKSLGSDQRDQESAREAETEEKAESAGESAGEAETAKPETMEKTETAETETTEKAETAEKVEVGPEQYATLDIDGNPTTTRPVYNLPKLLGPANVARLRSESSVFKEGSLFLLRSQRSGPTSMKLWSLQGYVADYKKL